MSMKEMPWKIQEWGNFLGDGVQLHNPLKVKQIPTECHCAQVELDWVLPFQGFRTLFRVLHRSWEQEGRSLCNSGYRSRAKTDLCIGTERQRVASLLLHQAVSKFSNQIPCFQVYMQLHSGRKAFLMVWLMRPNRLPIATGAAEIMCLELSWCATSEFFLLKI